MTTKEPAPTPRIESRWPVALAIPAGIFPGEAPLVDRFQGDIAIGGKSCAAQGCFAGLPRPVRVRTG
jgi:hypothetical protein